MCRRGSDVAELQERVLQRTRGEGDRETPQSAEDHEPRRGKSVASLGKGHYGIKIMDALVLSSAILSIISLVVSGLHCTYTMKPNGEDFEIDFQKD